MKKMLIVINTMGYGGAEKALLSLLSRIPSDQFEISLYVLLEQGELLDQVPGHIKILNRNYSKSSVLTAEGKRMLGRRVFARLFRKGAVFKNLPYLCENALEMAKKGSFHIDKLLWKVMADSAQKNTEHYDIAIAYLEGGAAWYVKQYVQADRKYAFIHVDYQKAGYSRNLDQGCYDAFDRIFPVSDEVKDSFLKVYPEYREKTFVFHNLIDYEEIRRKAELPGGFEDDYDGIRILTVGRLTEQKAYDVAIQAMALLKKKGVRARWYVLGEGELRKKLQKQAEQLGLTQDFLLLGIRENPYPYYKQCDLYVHATKYEGKSIAVQEAQTLGCAILVSDCEGNREQVTDGVDGRMCSLTPEGICEGIRKLLADIRAGAQYGTAAAEKVQEENSWRELLEI